MHKCLFIFLSDVWFPLLLNPIQFGMRGLNPPPPPSYLKMGVLNARKRSKYGLYISVGPFTGLCPGLPQGPRNTTGPFPPKYLNPVRMDFGHTFRHQMGPKTIGVKPLIHLKKKLGPRQKKTQASATEKMMTFAILKDKSRRPPKI